MKMDIRSPSAGIEQQGCPLPIKDYKTIQLAHGSGGLLSRDLIKRVLLPAFGNSKLNVLNDQAELDMRRGRISFTTDSFVVDPIFFPGGNIGDLAVNGTVNDLATGGAQPKWMSVGFILEEGFPMADFQRVVESMAVAARRAGVLVVTGDTKVVNQGKGDGIFINTSGIGIIHHKLRISADNLRVGDKLIVTGTVGDHGICILSQREQFALDLDISSDTACLHELVAALIDSVGGAIHALRDPTRGGVAAVLNEFAESSRVGIEIDENLIPVKKAVAGACEVLGIDPLHIANEGKLIVVVSSDVAQEALSVCHDFELGKAASIIGEVVSRHPGTVVARTILGSERMILLPVGEQLPRIC
jgi:hydrogenase expression/formation protein HypE